MNFAKNSQNTKKNLGAVTPADFEKLRQLRKMQRVAIWLLLAMALIFAVAFSLQDKFVFFGYVRAASEGGMVGAIADWFAVTALFRHPLGVPIPHTNLIAKKKDDIGSGLGAFIEDNFLADEVVYDKLASISGARHAGEWLSNPANAQKVNELVSEAGIAALTVLADSDVQSLFESIFKKHVVDPEWSSNIGRVLDSVSAAHEHDRAVDIVADFAYSWLVQNPGAFDKMVSSRMPSWVPGFANRFVDKKMHSEALKFVAAVRADQGHPMREAVTKMLQEFAFKLQNDDVTQRKVERFKHEFFTSKRVREISLSVWSGTKAALLVSLRDPASELRLRFSSIIRDAGSRLAEDSTLQYKVDVWVMQAISYTVKKYRGELAGVVTDTVQGWDASDAAQKIELQIGKDLQFIRINGTVVGALAGLMIYSVATVIKTLFAA